MAPRYDYGDMHIDSMCYIYQTAVLAAHCYKCKMIFVSVAVTPRGVTAKVKEKYRSHIRTGICDERMLVLGISSPAGDLRVLPLKSQGKNP